MSIREIVAAIKSLNLVKEMRDQSAHACVALAALLPFGLLPCILTGLFSGAVIGFLAELKEEDSSVSLASLKAVLASRGSLLDISAYALAGAIAGLLA
jgi:uncharacterized membrane protein SpoIIM required for sporulation